MKPLYVKKNGVVYKISGNGMPASYPAADVEYDNTVTSELQATDVQGAIDELSTRQDTNTKNTAYGTCDTAGNVKDKVATLSNATNWILEVGTIVGVRFTYTNTYAPSSGNAITLNVNNTGAKNIRYGDGIGTGTGDIKNPTAFGEAGQTIYYMYDGTYWVWVSHSKDNDTLYNFVGREFRSCNFQDAGLATGFGGDANLMVVNGVYYYNSNGPSTSIGASANDGSVFVHVCDDGYVVQIAQNYETGNIFVRAMNDNIWSAWKKPNANITGNNTVLNTDKTPFLTRQTLNPTGFSGYVREKLIGASYAWNNFAKIALTQASVINNVTCTPNSDGSITLNGTTNTSGSFSTAYNYVPVIAGHKYLLFAVGSAVSKGISVYTNIGGNVAGNHIIRTSETSGNLICTIRSDNNKAYSNDKVWVVCCDLTLAFGSTIADYLYSLTNNGGITKLRDMGFPFDKYMAYGNYLVSSKTSGKKIVGKNLCEEKWRQGDWNETTAPSRVSIQNDSRVFLRKDVTYYIYNSGYSTIYWSAALIYHKDDSAFFTTIPWKSTETFTYTPSQDCYLAIVFKKANEGNITPQDVYDNVNFMVCHNSITDKTYEPYSSTTYSLGNDELRGKFDLVNGEIVASGDVKESNGEITRNWKLVNLGSLNYDYISNGTFFQIQSTMSDIKASATVLSAKYVNNVPSSVNSDNMIIGVTTSKYLRIRDTAYTDATTFKTALNGVYAIIELATPTTEQSTPFADPMSLVGATTEEYIDTRDIPCPVGAERQYMGQSEDVIEIPSMPQSDGVRYLKSYKSGNHEQLVWEGEGIEDVSSYFTEGICDDFEVGAVRYGRIISFNMACTPISGGNYIAVIRTYVPAYALSHVGSINVCAQSASGLHIEAVVSRYTDAAARIKFYTNETLAANEKIYVSGTYICDIIK